MHHRARGVLFVYALATAAIAKEEYEVGGPLEGPRLAPFPSQHGELPGYPGWLPNQTDKDSENEDDKESQDTQRRPGGLMPQFQVYPGSVENWRAYWLKYVPVRPMVDSASLLKKWVAPDIPGAASKEEYAAPLYKVPRHKPPTPTDKFNKPVPVVRVQVGSAPIDLDLGELPIGLYVVRVVGAVETKYIDPQRKPIYLRMTVNDGNNGESNNYRMRIGYVDEIYSLAEFYFHAPEKRRYKATLRVDADSTAPLLVQCVDLHDVLAGSVRRPIKKQMTLSTEAERDYLRKQNKPPKSTSITNMTQRLEQDVVIWGALPPINAQIGGIYGMQKGYAQSVVFGANGLTMEQIEEQQGKWEHYAARRYDTSPNPVLLVNTNLRLQYTVADLAALKPLPDPYPIKDTGASVATPGKDGKPQQNFTVIADACARRISQFCTDLKNNAAAYYQTGDAEAGWRAAMELCRVAWQYPSWDGTQTLGGLITDPGGFERDYRSRRRGPELHVDRVDGAEPDYLLRCYDQVFDVIKGNKEFASSVGRFIPWVKTPEDVIQLLDVYLVQNQAKRVLRYNFLYDNHPTWIVTPATVLADRSVTDPWLAWLFAKAYIYPQSPTGLGDIVTTGNDRDGVGYIGSWSYSLGEQAGVNGRALDTYIRAGGNPLYDLTDARRFPNVIQVPSFMIGCWMAGLHFPRIGDVGGPDKPYGYQFDSTLKFAASGWEWTKDAKFAYLLKHYVGRAGQDDKDWAEIEKAAATVARAPWFDNRSRVLINWFGVLETGVEHDDFRFRRSAMLRIGQGYGHAHQDTLDLQITAHGLPMTVDAGQRPGYGKPGDAMTRLHNVVEVDGKDFQGHAWIRTLTDGPGARYMLAEAVSTRAKSYRRQVALIDVDEGGGSQKLTPEQFKPGTKLSKEIVTPNSYVVDIVRVSGGKMHTYCFHAALEDELTTNIEGQKPYEQLSAAEQEYVNVFRNQPIEGYPIQPQRYGGTAPDHLEATWRMAREIPGTGLGESEMTINFDPQSPRKFTKLHLLGHKGDSVLTGWYWCRQWSYGFNNLYIQKRSEKSADVVFPAIIEPYAGTPFITSCKLLNVEGNESDAERPVAIEVKTANGHTDLVFMNNAAAESRLPAVVGITNHESRITAEFACVSTDKDGLRLASISGGTLLEAPDVRLELAARERTGKIVKANYAEKQMVIESDSESSWPTGRAFEVGVPGRMTTYMAQRVEGGKTATITTVGGAAMYCSRVLRSDAAKQEIACKLGLPPVAAVVCAGLDKNLVASNEAGTKFWRAEYKGPVGGGSEYIFTLDAPFTEKDLPVGSGFRVWEYGLGDTVRQATFATLQRIEANHYRLTADVGLTLRLRGKTAEFSHDGQDWKRTPSKSDGDWLVVAVSPDLVAKGPLDIKLGQ